MKNSATGEFDDSVELATSNDESAAIEIARRDNSGGFTPDRRVERDSE
jgi:hypothetical protein